MQLMWYVLWAVLGLLGILGLAVAGIILGARLQERRVRSSHTGKAKRSIDAP